MGWFSPVKGSMYSLSQVDKTLPVDASAGRIERGMILALSSDDGGNAVWKIADGTEKMLFVAFQDSSDPTAGFAGTAFDPKGGVPCITGIDLAQDGEYETSVFGDGDFAVGAALYVKNGKLTTETTPDGKVVGYVTVGKKERWINNAIAVPSQDKGPTDPRLAVRTGARNTVIRFKTA